MISSSSKSIFDGTCKELNSLGSPFLEFTLSETFANIIPTTNWSYPVIKTKKGLPKEFNSLHVPSKMLLLDDEIIELNRKQYQDEWLDAFM